ncbi:hypothetical protein HNV10_13075 [Winogradskyella litoriviva]|uniref:FUSC family protein n=1 Tax=Winogradskyella litoriviva TaxID=1220182 RepID=A0ABX2E6V0_9FLAO|nr:hypothetical protein [Winogradskyella litoriviva]NRD24185.1 hypothetical protein [Winogradskyella litoriviva]
MKNILVVIGFTSAIVAAILSSSKFYSFSILPIIIAFVCGLVLLFISKNVKNNTKSIQYIFLLAIISLTLTIYKNVTVKPKNIETEQIDQNKSIDSESESELKQIEGKI